MKNSKSLPIIFTLIMSYLCSSSAFAAPTTPISTVERLHAQLLDNMQAGENRSYDERKALLNPIVRSSFDFPLIAKVVLGNNWDELDMSQQAEFIELFTKLSVASYASQFTSHNTEQFHTLGDKPKKRGRVLVLTEFQTSDRTIKFDYWLQPSSDNWRIINIVVDGVSDLSLKRSDYGAILENQGFDELVRKLQEKIEISDTNDA